MQPWVITLCPLLIFWRSWVRLGINLRWLSLCMFRSFEMFTSLSTTFTQFCTERPFPWQLVVHLGGYVQQYGMFWSAFEFLWHSHGTNTTNKHGPSKPSASVQRCFPVVHVLDLGQHFFYCMYCFGIHSPIDLAHVQEFSIIGHPCPLNRLD